MNRLNNNAWECGHMLRLGLQFFAEETGDDGGTVGHDSCSETGELPEGHIPDAATTNDGGAQSYYDAMSREERAEFLKKNGLMHHTAATARYKSATDKAAKLDGLHGSFADLAKVYGLDEGDYGAILKAALDRPRSMENGTDGDHTQALSEECSDFPQATDGNAQELRPDGETAEMLSAENALSEQGEAVEFREAELMRMIRQEEETKDAYPNFDFGTASRNPAFKAMVDAGLPMKTAYESAFHAELSAAAMEAVRAQARAEALAEYRANRARPEEGAACSTGEAIMTLNYRQMTKEQLRAAEKKYL
jgi:hypothetical protein